ncbi:hypothetical protein F4819DRAFT_465929, partial [Hypoxylon fuscum]
MGYTVLLLSLRLAPVAIVNLLKQTNCNMIVHGRTPQIESTIAAAKQEASVGTLYVPSRSEYSAPRPENEKPFVR